MLCCYINKSVILNWWTVNGHILGQLNGHILGKLNGHILGQLNEHIM